MLSAVGGPPRNVSTGREGGASGMASVVAIRSPNSSLSSVTVFPGKANDLRMETGRPAVLPGV